MNSPKNSNTGTKKLLLIILIVALSFQQTVALKKPGFASTSMKENPWGIVLARGQSILVCAPSSNTKKHLETGTTPKNSSTRMRGVQHQQPREEKNNNKRMADLHIALSHPARFLKEEK
jgi:hypothetical protein